jgi:hypothetical protein
MLDLQLIKAGNPERLEQANKELTPYAEMLERLELQIFTTRIEGKNVDCTVQLASDSSMGCKYYSIHYTLDEGKRWNNNQFKIKIPTSKDHDMCVVALKFNSPDYNPIGMKSPLKQEKFQWSLSRGNGFEYEFRIPKFQINEKVPRLLRLFRKFY